jgi:hypothetical protein
MRDPRFRDQCCRCWRAFDERRIGEEIANYSREVFDLIGRQATEGQLAAMQSFPPEGLLLLRSFIVQFLCPEQMRLKVEYKGVKARKASISISIDEDNLATVTFRAPVIP